MVRTPYFHCKGAQVQFLIRELKILHAGQCGKKKNQQTRNKKTSPPKWVKIFAFGLLGRQKKALCLTLLIKKCT